MPESWDRIEYECPGCGEAFKLSLLRRDGEHHRPRFCPLCGRDNRGEFRWWDSEGINRLSFEGEQRHCRSFADQYENPRGLDFEGNG